MAISRRILSQNYERNVGKEDQKHLGVRPSKKIPAKKSTRARVVLGDVGNANNVKHDSNQPKKMEAKVKVERAETEDKVMRKDKAMSICEQENLSSVQNCLPAAPCDSLKSQIKEERKPNIIDIDEDNSKDPYQCPEYAADIIRYLRCLERKLRVGDYIHKQKEINERMRSILVDWLIQVHGRFGLLQETLYLTVNIIDRFLECTNVKRSNLQLVGVSAMLLASKYEETYAPEIGDFVYISDNSYTSEQIKKMERQIFRTLKFDLSNPLCLHFLRRNSKAALADAKQHTLAKYFMELTLVDYNMARVYPSKIAAASLMLAGRVLHNSEWTETLEYYSSYSESDLTPIVESLKRLISHAETSKLQAVKSKFSSSKHLSISTIQELKEMLATGHW